MLDGTYAENEERPVGSLLFTIEYPFYLFMHDFKTMKDLIKHHDNHLCDGCVIGVSRVQPNGKSLTLVEFDYDPQDPEDDDA